MEIASREETAPGCPEKRPREVICPMPLSSIASLLEISNDLSLQQSRNEKRGHTYDTRPKMAIGLSHRGSVLALDSGSACPVYSWQVRCRNERRHRRRISL